MPRLESSALLDDFFRLHPKKIDLSLDRLDALLEKMNRPEALLPPVFHVAGTNGKGSVAAFLLASLEAAGYVAHSYVSPHLLHFHERITLGRRQRSGTISSRAISETNLTALLKEAKEVNGGAPITFFEATTAVAFLAFARAPADYLILETGLGGRLDATNVIKRPLATLITPIGMDHSEYLGKTLASIAAEKAGIFKKRCAAFSSKQTKNVEEVIARHAAEKEVPLFMEGRDWRIRKEGEALLYEDQKGAWRLPMPSLYGAHQMQNAALAAAALRHSLHPDGVLHEAVKKGVARAKNPARLQRLHSQTIAKIFGKDAEVWLDGGHNPHAARVLAREMRAMSKTDSKDFYLISAMMKGKDARGFLRPFGKIAKKLYALPIRDQESAESAQTLAKAAKREGLSAKACASLEEAGADFLRQCGRRGNHSRILICGSLYFAADILRKI